MRKGCLLCTAGCSNDVRSYIIGEKGLECFRIVCLCSIRPSNSSWLDLGRTAKTPTTAKACVTFIVYMLDAEILEHGNAVC